MLLTGHSQGGISEANIASDPLFTSRYNVGGVMTLGSPVNTMPIDPSIPVMNFSHHADMVPKLDLAGTGQSPHVQEVHLSGPWNPLAAHETANYQTSIAGAQNRPEVIAFNDKIKDYYGTGTTYSYEIGRN